MKKAKTDSVSIILPCIGQNISSDFPYSTELVRVSEKMSLIDYSFQHILACHTKPRVIVIVGPHKSDLVQYLFKKYSKKVDLVFFFQKTERSEIASAFRSVEHLLGNKNVLLLPSAIIEHKDKKLSLINQMLKTLDRQPFVFACKDETSVSRLKSSGALRIEKGEVLGYEERPIKDFQRFNAFWVSFGFNKSAFREVVSVLEQGQKRKNNFDRVFKKSIFYKTSPVMVSGYFDISTWTNLNAYLLRQYLIKSGVDPLFLKM